MDIRKWLDDTVQPEAPRESNNLHQAAEPAKRKRRHRSDSSILDPRPPASSPHESVDDSADEALQATCSDSSSSSRYARKPRRKTRPERYEPQHAPGPHAHRDRRGGSKKTRSKPRRKKGEKPPVVMQTFQAKNVSGDRLTLKPREQLGLFNKGRTSTAFMGRGLPDLVFSEMKFLQKHKDEPELVLRTEPSKKKRKKDNEQIKEGEISAFFTSARPALFEKNTNTLPQPPAPKTKRRRHDRSSVDEVAIPIVEATVQAPYLGFGSRGPRHESDSYISWSESIQAPSTAPARPHKFRIRPSSHDVDFHDESESRRVKENEPFKVPARPPPMTKRRVDSSSVDHFRVSSLAPSHSRASRSQSYPQHTSSPRRPNLVDRSTNPRATDNVYSPSSMPPSRPKHVIGTHRTRLPSSSKIDRSDSTPVSGMTASSGHRQENQNREYSPAGERRIPTSSDLGVVLRHCNDTFHERRLATGSRRRHTEETQPSYLQSTMRQNTRDMHHAAHRGPNVHFADQSHHRQRQRSHTQWELDEGLLQSPFPSEENYLDQDDQTGYDDEMEHDTENWGEVSEEPPPHSLDDIPVMCDNHEAYAETEAELVQDSRPGNDTVAPGFWRPNKLY
ncbi:hypothetical protein BKA58DRAFT_453277 [Alternaria rosae]|uniref:uncharacterized protein n=1 Tax=Alternaria rosae TaxID=1187941 RepID=UPI001E8D2D3C|nr:uncharacterized protein BKA58DRAFT_453277 [Alternaria rosae]KAH6879061.1 hypothetical protein BKA58DRAFT_453277 [Alternaria rosae]